MIKTGIIIDEKHVKTASYKEDDLDRLYSRAETKLKEKPAHGELKLPIPRKPTGKLSDVSEPVQ